MGIESVNIRAVSKTDHGKLKIINGLPYGRERQLAHVLVRRLEPDEPVEAFINGQKVSLEGVPAPRDNLDRLARKLMDEELKRLKNQ